MTVLLASTIAAARKQVGAFMLPDSCAVQSLVGAASDGAGGETGGTWTTQDVVACQVTTSGGNEQVVADGVAEVADVSILVPAETTVAATYRIVHTEAKTGAVTTYYAVTVSKPTRVELGRTIAARVKVP